MTLRIAVCMFPFLLGIAPLAAAQEGVTAVDAPMDDPLEGLFGEISAEDARRAVELATEARDAYNAGEPGRAIALFEQAFDLSRDPGFAFNLGALYEAMDEIPRARSYYEGYLELLPDAPNRAEVEATLERLEAILNLEWARVRVESMPDEVQVYVVRQGQEFYLGRTPVQRWMRPGEVSLRFRLPGHSDVELNGRAEIDGILTLTGLLQPLTVRRERMSALCERAPTDARCTESL
jgi:tetratricopeptide (TPR) repeat protein